MSAAVKNVTSGTSSAQSSEAPYICRAILHRVSASHNGFIHDICGPLSRAVAECMSCAITILQYSFLKTESAGEGIGGLISRSQQGPGQTISWRSAALRIPCEWHAAAPGPLFPTERPFMGRATCIQRGCALGVSVWTGIMGAEKNLQRQKASYETKEGQPRGGNTAGHME